MSNDEDKENLTEGSKDEATTPDIKIEDNPPQKELDKLKNDYLYLKADFENYKKRSIKERVDTMKYAAEHAFVGILQVLDNFERALKAVQDENSLSSLREGVILIEKEFRNVLQQYGVDEVPVLNKKFDPNICESIGYVDNDEIAEGFVAQVLRRPFKLHDKIIRPGQVLVSSGKKPSAAENN